MDLSYVDGKIWILSAVDSLASAMVKTEKMPRGRKFEKKDGYVEVDTGKVELVLLNLAGRNSK
jgi:hypothetical protein